jgi:hypothetical protein
MTTRAENLPIGKTMEKLDMKAKLSTLWIFAMFNYLYADVVSLMDPASLNKIITGTVGSIQITEGFLLGAAILMETAIAMVLLSRVLKYRVNRWLNIIVGVLHTVVVLLAMVLAGTMPTLYYIFFVTVETVCTLLIIWLALRWKPAATPAAAR